MKKISFHPHHPLINIMTFIFTLVSSKYVTFFMPHVPASFVFVPTACMKYAYLFFAGGKYSLINRAQWIMAMAQWLTHQVPPYSTELLISIRIVIVLLAINLRALDDLKCNNQSKDLILVVHFYHLGTMKCFYIECRNPASPLPVIIQCMHLATSSGSQLLPLDMLPAKSF